MTDEQKTLKDYMTQAQKDKLKNLPTWHSICTEKTGVARPGKTARDRVKRSRQTLPGLETSES